VRSAEDPAAIAERGQYRLTLGRFERPSRTVNSCAPAAEIGYRNLQDTPVRQDYGTLDRVLELAHVPRPVVVAKDVHGVGGDSLDPLVHAPGELLREVADETGNVVRTFPQCRQRDRKDV